MLRLDISPQNISEKPDLMMDLSPGRGYIKASPAISCDLCSFLGQFKNLYFDSYGFTRFLLDFSYFFP